MILNVSTFKVHATDIDTPDVIIQGPVVRYYKSNGEDVTEEVEKLSQEQIDALLNDWVKICEVTTDKDGKIVLPDWLTEGDIKIVETKIPDGYIADKEETIVNLSQKEVEIVNKKKEEPKLEEPPKKEEPKPTPKISLPKTGIDILRPYYVDIEAPDVNLEGPEGKIPQPNKANFTIKKVDQDGKPLEGAKFEVYGRINLLVLIIVFKEYYVIPGDIDISGPKVDIDPPYGEDAPENEYIEDNINIHIEGIDNDFVIDKVVKPGEQYFSIFVKPGKYKISETTNLIGTTANESSVYKIQSYLSSYQFEIKKDGNAEVGDPEWQWLVSDSDSGIFEFITLSTDEDSWIYECVGVTHSDNNQITIFNYSSSYHPK